MASPLTRLASLKVKLGALVGISVLVSATVATLGATHGVSRWLVIPVAVAISLILTQLLAAGMIAPLREMTEAARRMARGDYSARIDAQGRDEVATLARAFTTMAADLKDVDQQRRDLVATVSHELRTPAAALRAVLENMADGVTPADEAGLRSVLAQAERLSDLLADLLALSRIDAGLAPLRTRSVDVAGLLADAGCEITLSGREVPVRVEVVPPDLHVAAEPMRLRQAITNLLDNAARHSPPGSEVRVTARLASLDGDRDSVDGQGHSSPRLWTIDIEDDGPGIRAEDRQRIFDRFGTAAAGGTGLGLAITRWVAEIHGGRVDALDPRPGHTGARLRLTLPVEPHVRTVTALPSPSTPSPPTVPDHRPPAPASPSNSITGPGATMSFPSTRPTPPLPAPYPAGSIPLGPGRTPPPAMDSAFGSLWPEVDVPGRPRLLLAALAVGLLAAVILPFRDQGVGTTLVLLAGGATLAAAARRRSWLTAVCGVLGIALALIPMLRAAGWLIPLTLLAGAVTVVIGVTPARSLTALIGSALAWPLAGLRGLPWLGRMLSTSRRTRAWWPVIRTAAVSLAVLVVFGALFASADAVVAHWVDLLVPDLSIDTAILRGFVFCACFGIVLAGCYLAINPIMDASLTLPAGRVARHAWEWLVPAALVIATYAVFIAAQVTAWLAGHEYVERTTGVTYAEYARQGFGQLTVAMVLTILLVGVVARHASRAAEGDRVLLRAVLGLLGVLTLVVIASAMWRMNLYQQAYGFTTLRVVVDAFEIWVGLVVLMVLLAGISLQGKWIPRAAALTGVGIVLGLGLMNPEAWVANRNVDRFERLGDYALDVAYLGGLSDDAIPAITERLAGQARTCTLAQYAARTHRSDDALEWNLGRSRARTALANLGVSVPDLQATSPACGAFDDATR